MRNNVTKVLIGDGGISATTDTNGNFVLTGAVSGEYKLAVLAGAIGIKKISVVVEKEKVRDTGDIILSFNPNSALRGTVVDTSGNPVSGAMLIVHGINNSGGYTIASSNGSFFLAGLDAGNYDILIVAYGYEQLSLPSVSVPSNNIKVILTPSPVQTSGILQYRLTKDNYGKEFLSKLIDYVSPSEAFAATCGKGSCPGGWWGGVTIDATLFIHPVGGVAMLSYFHCMSSSASLHVRTSCGNIEAVQMPHSVFGLASFEEGLGFGVCWDACCGEDFLGNSTGLYGGFNYVYKGHALSLSYTSNGCLDVMPGAVGWSFPDWGKLDVQRALRTIGISGGIVACNSGEYNFFADLCTLGVCL